MLRIAIVDDMQKDREILEGITYEIANDWGKEFDVKMFLSGETISRAAKNEEYDIILLDIQMEGIDGVKTARLLNTITPNSSVVFITSHDERVKSLFDFNIIGFIDKPVTREPIEKVLKKVVDRMEASDYYLYTYNGIKHSVKQEEILYICVYNHKVYMKTKNENIEISGTLKQVWQKLKEFHRFAMVNRSYIVNLNYVKFKNAIEIEIKYGDNIYDEMKIGRTLKIEFETRYTNYLSKIIQEGRLV